MFKKTRYVLLIDTGKLASKCHELKHKKLRHIEYTLLLVHKRLVDQRFKRGTRPLSFFFLSRLAFSNPTTIGVVSLRLGRLIVIATSLGSRTSWS